MTVSIARSSFANLSVSSSSKQARRTRASPWLRAASATFGRAFSPREASSWLAAAAVCQSPPVAVRTSLSKAVCTGSTAGGRPLSSALAVATARLPSRAAKVNNDFMPVPRAILKRVGSVRDEDNRYHESRPSGLKALAASVPTSPGVLFSRCKARERSSNCVPGFPTIDWLAQKWHHEELLFSASASRFR